MGVLKYDDFTLEWTLDDAGREDYVDAWLVNHERKIVADHFNDEFVADFYDDSVTALQDFRAGFRMAVKPLLWYEYQVQKNLQTAQNYASEVEPQIGRKGSDLRNYLVNTYNDGCENANKFVIRYDFDAKGYEKNIKFRKFEPKTTIKPLFF